MKKYFIPFVRLLRGFPKGRDWLMMAASVLLALVGVKVVSLVSDARVALAPKASTITVPWVPDTVKRWQGPIVEMSKKYNLDPDFIAIIMTLESGGYAQAESEAGAQGLMQVTPLTGKDIAAKFLKEPRQKYNLMDPRINIEFGAAYLAYLRDEFGTAKQGPSWDQTVELIAAGYNGGPGAANRLEQGKGLTDAETVVYSRDAFNMWRERHASKSPTFDRWQERGGSVLLELATSE